MTETHEKHLQRKVFTIIYVHQLQCTSHESQPPCGGVSRDVSLTQCPKPTWLVDVHCVSSGFRANARE